MKKSNIPTKHDDEIEDYLDWARDVERGDTVLSQHGMLTHDERYKGRTAETVNMIKNDNNLSNDQAYYFLYFMLTNDLTYEEAKDELLSSKDFENYDKLKRERKGII